MFVPPAYGYRLNTLRCFSLILTPNFNFLQGADPSARDGEGRTPLHHAVMRGHLAVVDILLAKGGPSMLLAKDILNCTPVHLAAVQNQVTLILRLVQSLLEDTEGRTPLHEVARRR